jgi:hypothetical protein
VVCNKKTYVVLDLCQNEHLDLEQDQREKLYDYGVCKGNIVRANKIETSGVNWENYVSAQK